MKQYTKPLIFRIVVQSGSGNSRTGRFESDRHTINKCDSVVAAEPDSDKHPLSDYLKFAFYCSLLLVPIYAIIISAIKGDWLMMIIDILLIPVGFVHGLLLLSGILT